MRAPRTPCPAGCPSRRGFTTEAAAPCASSGGGGN